MAMTEAEEYDHAVRYSQQQNNAGEQHESDAAGESAGESAGEPHQSDASTRNAVEERSAN